MPNVSEGAQIIIALISVGIPALAGVIIAGFKIIGAKIEAATTAARDASWSADAAHTTASQAVTYAKPTGNGFAAGVRADLALIIERQAQLGADVADLKATTSRLDGRLDRLESHA